MTENPADRWALPGSVAEPEGREADLNPPLRTAPAPAPAQPGARGGRSSLGATGLLVDDPANGDVPRLALRPMTVADILDGAFGIVKARPARLLGLTAVLVVPMYLMMAYLQRDALAGYGLWDVFVAEDPEVIEAVEEESSAAGPNLGSMLLGWVGPAVVLVFVAAAIAHMLGAWSARRDVPAGELLATVGKRSWALLASFVVVHVAELGVAFLSCGVALPFVMPFFVAVAPVIGAERAGPIDALARAGRLARRRYWPTLGISLLIGLVSLVLSSALSMFFLMVGTWIGLHVAWPLLAVGNIVAGVITTPFVAGATVLLYLDLRMRSEGLDLELAIRDAFGEARP